MKTKKLRSIERRYVPHYRNSVKKAAFPPNFTEIGQSDAELMPKITTFKTADVRHVEFKNAHIWPSSCHRVQSILLRTHFHQNLMIFRWDMAILQFPIWRPSAIFNFRNLEFTLCELHRHRCHLFCFPVQNFTEIRQSAAILLPKNDF